MKMMIRKPDSRGRRLPPEKLRVLEEVFVDLVGPFKVPSLRYRGRKGNQSGGGNLYVVVYVDKATERVFVSFVSHKSDLEADVRKMCAHM